MVNFNNIIFSMKENDFVILKDIRIRRMEVWIFKNSLKSIGLLFVFNSGQFTFLFHINFKFNIIPIIKVFKVSCKEWMCRLNRIDCIFWTWLQRFVVIMWAVFFTAKERIQQNQSVLRLVSYFISPTCCCYMSEAGHSAPFKEAAAFIG